MASVRITQFAGLMPEVHGKLINEHNAQIAHNCLLIDGKLRPYAKWVEKDLRSDSEHNLSIAYDKLRATAVQYPLLDAVTLEDAPMAKGYTVGAVQSPYYASQAVARYTTGSRTDRQFVGIKSSPIYGGVTYSRAYHSDKPVNRMYAATRVRKYADRAEEGPLWLIPGQDPRVVVYEGDLVNVSLYSDPEDGVTHYRIYRSITGLDTGQATTNELDTNWHLVDEIPFTPNNNVVYTDGASATASPLDVAYSGSFYGPAIKPDYFGLTESGWFVSASKTGEIQISERYLHHAWPTENDMRIPEKITDMVVQGDNVFFGTDGYPYILAVGMGEKAMQARIDRYKEQLPCLPGSMTATSFGAMYASGAGIVSATRDGIEVVTRDIANSGTVFSTRNFDALTNGGPTIPLDIGFSTTAFGHYHGGKYYGFCFDPIPPAPIGGGY